MHTIGVGTSHVGQRRRENEDRYLVDNDLGLYIVCDGMGGHAKGEVAAQLAIDTAAQHLRDHRDEIATLAVDGDTGQLEALVRAAVDASCRAVYLMGSQLPENSGMGCTLTLLLCAEHTAVMGHVGDSRLYLLRSDEISLMSQDHTYAAEMLRTGQFPPDEALMKRFKHVLSRAIGTQEFVQVDTLAFDFLPGDRLLLCSDGLSEYTTDNDWLAAQLASDEFDGIPDALVAHANAQGGKDNISAVVLRVAIDPAHQDAMLLLRTDIQVKLDALTGMFLFEDLSLAQITRVLDASQAQVWEQGRTLAAEGDPIADLIIVLDGELALSRGGTRLTTVGAGEHIGATSLARPRRARATLIATRKTRVLRLERQAFRDLCQARPWLGVALLERLVTHLGDSLDQALLSDAARGEAVDSALV